MVGMRSSRVMNFKDLAWIGIHTTDELAEAEYTLYMNLAGWHLKSWRKRCSKYCHVFTNLQSNRGEDVWYSVGPWLQYFDEELKEALRFINESSRHRPGYVNVTSTGKQRLSAGWCSTGSVDIIGVLTLSQSWLRWPERPESGQKSFSDHSPEYRFRRELFLKLAYDHLAYGGSIYALGDLFFG